MSTASTVSIYCYLFALFSELSNC